jgi:hypothetical protein
MRAACDRGGAVPFSTVVGSTWLFSSMAVAGQA